LVVFLARGEGLWLGLAAVCEAAEVDALVGPDDDGTFVVSELVGDPPLQETRINSIGSIHDVFTQPSIHPASASRLVRWTSEAAGLGTAERAHF
jgi:hypothetical protein